ncbi:MAG: metallophosphoesterase [Actinomycetota bacterium]
MASPYPTAGLLAAAAAGLPAACVAWGLLEARLYRVRPYTLPVLPEGAAPLRVLQVSDLHLRTPNERLASFVESLGEATYDLVLATGDLLGEPEAVERCARALNRLKARAGRFFVLGSSDYYAPQFKNYTDYFLRRRPGATRCNPTPEFLGLLREEGWIDLTNRTLALDLKGTWSQITGLDDPFLGRDDRSLLVRDPQASFALCVVHDPAPYLDARRGGFDLVVAGHTHGGQVRFPFVGAVVTNSELPRHLARGPTWLDGTWLHVSPGLGTGKFAPFRFLCRPEASVLRLTPRAGKRGPAAS